MMLQKNEVEDDAVEDADVKGEEGDDVDVEEEEDYDVEEDDVEEEDQPQDRVCEHARSKRTSNHKSHFLQKFGGKMPFPRTATHTLCEP